MTDYFTDYDDRLRLATEHYFNFSDRPAVGSIAFYRICDQLEVEPGDLEDAIQEAGYVDLESEAHPH